MDEALEALESLIDEEPDDLLDLVEQKMGLLYGAGKMARAARTLPELLRREKKPYPRGLMWALKIIAENPEDAKEWRQLARIRERRKEPVAAYDALKKALALKPGHGKTLERAGYLASKLGRAGDAIDLLTEYVGTEKKDRKALRELAFLLLRAGRTDEAARRFKEWRSLGSPDTPTLLEYGRILLHMGRYGEGTGVLEEASAAGSDEAGNLVKKLKRDLLDGEIGERVDDLAGEGAAPSARLALARSFLERGLFRPAASQAMQALSDTEVSPGGETLEFIEGLHEREPADPAIAFF
ncbi:MAG: tetratricopeptide repeat protein, partial [Planctomycetota bacterium]